jgi:hypothetical protein
MGSDQGELVMNVERNVDRTKEDEARGDVRERRGTLRGGHDPVESGRLSGQRRRERKRAAEKAVEAAALDSTHDRLAVTARLAVVTASELTVAELRQIVRDLKERAREGGHVGNRAAELLLGMAQAAVNAADDDPEGKSWTEMTPAERAARRASLDRLIAEMEARERERETGKGNSGG